MFTKITKTVIGALVLTGVSLAVTASAYSAPRRAQSQVNGSYMAGAYSAPRRGPSQAYESYMTDHHNPTDTNGF